MRKFIVPVLAGAMSLAAFQAMAADKVTLQLKWVTQAQFAGYYVAKDKGFYTDEGLDVDIKPGGPDIAPSLVPEGMVLVLGDHRGASADGRWFGLVPEQAFYGRALGVYWRRGEGPVWKRL